MVLLFKDGSDHAETLLTDKFVMEYVTIQAFLLRVLIRIKSVEWSKSHRLKLVPDTMCLGLGHLLHRRHLFDAFSWEDRCFNFSFLKLRAETLSGLKS